VILKVVLLVTAAVATGTAARVPHTIPMVTQVYACGQTSHLRFEVFIECPVLACKESF
jgi:hypothetical protein